MDRQKIVAALVEEFKRVYPHMQESMFVESLKRITSDTSLLAFAIEVGIDTDAVLAPEARP